MEPVAKILEQLATQLGTTVQYLWGVLIKQAQIVIIQDAVLIGLAMVFFLFTKRVHSYLKKFHDERKKENGYLDFNGWLAALIVYWGIWIVLIFITINIASELVTAALNPEYWALEQILSKLHK